MDEPLVYQLFRQEHRWVAMFGRDTSSWGGLRAYMLSALLLSGHSYPALLLAEQLVH